MLYLGSHAFVSGDTAARAAEPGLGPINDSATITNVCEPAPRT
jgi:hypothetical protein